MSHGQIKVPGLDNTTADGLCAFSTLWSIVTKLDLMKEKQNQLIENLELGNI